MILLRTSFEHKATSEASPAYLSSFGGLWPDRLDADELLTLKLERKAITESEAAQLQAWIANGYVSIPNAVARSDVDALLADADRYWQGQQPRIRVENGPQNYVVPTPALRGKPGCRLLDSYYFSEATRRVIFSPPIVRFLHLVFERDILAFQSLLFERGSQQGIHQDPAYVVLSSPMELAASWIALEDIGDGAGPLVYYEGSHRLPDFIFGGQYKHWNPDRDGYPIEQEYREVLEETARRQSLPLRRFTCKKGDALLWHANLAHGGSMISNPDPQITRRSLATHYCPYDIDPHYFELNAKQRAKIHWKGQCYYSSAYYAPVDQASQATGQVGLLSGLAGSAVTILRSVKPVVKPFIPAAVRKLLRRLIARQTI